MANPYGLIDSAELALNRAAALRGTFADSHSLQWAAQEARAALHRFEDEPCELFGRTLGDSLDRLLDLVECAEAELQAGDAEIERADLLDTVEALL